MQDAGRCRGVALVEICVVVAIAAVLAAVVMPSFRSLLDQQKVAGVASELATDLAHARSEAVSRGSTARISFQNTVAGTCYLLHTGSSNSCQCTPAQTAECMNGAQAFKVVLLPSSGNVKVTANVATFAYHPAFGTVTPAGTITIQGPPGVSLRHVVNIMGRVRTCAPVQPFGGYKSC